MSNGSKIFEFSFRLSITADNEKQAKEQLRAIVTDCGTGPGFEREELWNLDDVKDDGPTETFNPLHRGPHMHPDEM